LDKPPTICLSSEKSGMYLQGNSRQPTLSLLKLSPELFILPVQSHSENGTRLSLAQPKKCN